MTGGASAVSRVSTWVRRIFVVKVVAKVAARAAVVVVEGAVEAVVEARRKVTAKAGVADAAEEGRDEVKAPTSNPSRIAIFPPSRAKDCLNYTPTAMASCGVLKITTLENGPIRLSPER